MTTNQVIVFRARAPRSHLVSAFVGALALTSGILGALLRVSRGLPHGPAEGWLKVGSLLASLLVVFTAILWTRRVVRDRRRVVSVMESGIQCPEGYCAWNTMTEATVRDNPDDPCIVVKGRYLAHGLVIPLQVTEDGAFRRLVEQYGGEHNPLAEALASVGA